ncbi:MAG: ATP-dependent sacrificial sulfur transferase LarE [Firmicutes bacterium]|nr:ATP-dependent sacrificial sulfur transferase LarE [Bacillota bacterium]
MNICSKRIILKEKWPLLSAYLKEQGRGGLAVAYSGGVDSALLAEAAWRVLGAKVMLVYFDMPLNAAADRRQAVALAQRQGWPCQVVEADPLQTPEVAANGRRRCYFCKSYLYRLLRREAETLGLAALADGVNADDLTAYRPGNLAAEEAGILHPLAEAGFHKADIRLLARHWRLPNWDRPASPCLASRFPYEQPLTLENLRLVEAGEKIIAGYGFAPLRLRVHGDIARIEAPRETLPRLIRQQEMIDALRQLGFRYITVDAQGLRSGSMDE